MKKLFAIVLSFAAISLCGCIQDKIFDRQPGDDEVLVTSTIDGLSTRASIVQFATGNAIGIYKLPAGAADFETAHRENAHYTYTGESKFAPIDEPSKLFWKETAVDFVAYYPYEAGVESDDIYDIDVTDQIDFLYSEKVTNKTKTDGTVNFTFHHKLSKVIFDITDEDTDIDLTGISVVIKGLNTTAGFDLETGTLGTAGTVADIATTTYDVADNKAKAYAIVLPATGAGFEVVFTLADGYTATQAFSGKDFAADMQRTYPITLKIEEEQLEIEVGGSTIDPWGDGGSEEPTEVEKTYPQLTKVV